MIYFTEDFTEILMISSFWLIYKKEINIRNQYPDSVFYDKLTKIFKGVTEKHAPLKKQKVPENNFGNKWEITFFKLIVGMMSEK